MIKKVKYNSFTINDIEKCIKETFDSFNPVEKTFSTRKEIKDNKTNKTNIEEYEMYIITLK